MTTYDGKTVVVTGAAGALGGGLAQAFADDGAAVVGLDRVTPADEHTVAGVDYRALDLTDDVAVASALDEVPEPWAVVHTVGGFAPAGSLSELDVEQLETQLAINLTTSAVVLKHALRRLSGAGQGRVVLTASRAAFQSKGVGFAYSASKLAVVHLVEMAATEVAGSGVTVNAVSPTIIDTPANRQAMPDAKHDTWPTPADLAPAYLFLASPAAARVNGSILSV
jgi:NAD(P)-dependent dehydrogenase (short-subunit alcohol dehydrogenase family)